MNHRRGILSIALLAAIAVAPRTSGQVLDKYQQVEAQEFWDNRDWDWYFEHIPFFECPDPELTTTYYYRWELLTKHLTYGSPNSGYSFTEFIDRPFWSGAYGAISCPAGHQLYEARWLRRPRIAFDYSRYWLRTPGAQPHRYSNWLADSVWAIHCVYDAPEFARDLLADLVRNYEAWEAKHFVPSVGLFWQTGHDDGMEFNINSRQTKDIVRGAPAFRPTINAYMWADAVAIAKIADLAGDSALARKFRDTATGLKERLQTLLWDEKREFFFPMSRDEEERDGVVVKARTLTYASGKYAGSPHGRELIGYVPWQFGLPDAGQGYEASWRFLMDPEFFHAPFGPTTVERNDPQFVLKKTCCWWSGQSWPYATTQTLKAMANLLQNYDQRVVTRGDYAELLRTYSRSHRKDGRPYLAEALHPDTGSFEGHDGYNHSEHYLHSGFCDLVITGLVGIVPRPDDTIEVDPLAPDTWEFFALDDVVYHGRRVSIIWDRNGTRYSRGKGLQVIADGRVVARSPALERLTGTLPPRAKPAAPRALSTTPTNFAVNNDGDYFPRIVATHTGPHSSPSKLVDGNYWYHLHPPNRWTAAGSTSATDRIEIDLGVARAIHTIKLYFLDDGEGIVPPRSVAIDTWAKDRWQPLPSAERSPATPTGRRANIVRIPATSVRKLRFTFRHADGGRTGLTEIEVWGDAELPVAPAPPPAGNLAFNPGDRPYPKASASHTSRFDRIATVNDGRVVYTPTPANRWTSYESKSDSDWLEIDFGGERTASRADLHIYDDRGGVQPPASYRVEWFGDEAWKPVEELDRSPAAPTGSVVNSVRFRPVKTTKLRIVFVHAERARTGLTEIEIWKE